MNDNPRALVALSEDRQAIVFLTRSNWWAGHYLNGYGDVGERAFIAEDTGQDAQEVLAAFLAGREA